MDIRNLKGSIVALVTPFHADGSVNFDKLRELVDWHIENKTDAILTLGTTGESSTMTHEEDDAVLRTVIEAAAGRVPVVPGPRAPLRSDACGGYRQCEPPPCGIQGEAALRPPRSASRRDRRPIPAPYRSWARRHSSR